MNPLQIIGIVVMWLGIAFMAFGVVGIFQPRKDFFYRILVACNIDTVGLLTFAIGMAMYQGLSFFTGKVVLIVVVIMVLNPLVAHLLVRAAHQSGETPGKYTDRFGNKNRQRKSR